MSVLDRINIIGIRSFGPYTEEKIKFSTPLTLFLGQNGCGKTTIIECLKYALTGDLPTNCDRGGGFVNDPKLSNKNSTKACVKVRFKDVQGNLITVGKFIEVQVQSGGKLKFKGLSPSIKFDDGIGDPKDISGRVDDINIYCCQKLNVSKAIINNVLLCHQENAAWPLEEGKKLKEKFDEIFGAAEYNKCVEKLRKMIKEKKQNIKVLKAEFETCKNSKQLTDKLRNSLVEKEARLDEAIKYIEDKSKSKDPLGQKLNEINKIIDNLSSIQQKLTGLETALKGESEKQDGIKKHLTEEYQGTDKELQSEITNFNMFQEEVKKDIAAKETKQLAINDKMNEINQMIQKLQISFGQLKQEEVHYKKNREDLENLIEKAKAKFSIDLDESDSMTALLYQLSSALKSEESKLNNQIKCMEAEEKRLQTNIDQIRTRNASAQENRSAKSKSIAEHTRKIEQIKAKLATISSSNKILDSINNRIEDLKKTINKKKLEFDENLELDQLAQLDVQINQQEEYQNRLQREQRVLQQNSFTQEKIDKEKSGIEEKREELDYIKQKHEQKFKDVFAENLPKSNFEGAVNDILKKEDEKVRSITMDISKVEKKITTLEGTIGHSNKRLQSYKEELSENQSKIKSVCKGQEFSTILEETYSKKEKLQRDKGAYRSSKSLFEQFISQFERETPCCPVCSTDFTSEKAKIPVIISALRKRIESLPNKLAHAEFALKKEEETYNKLQQLKPLHENVKSLEEVKIPLLQDELEKFQNDLEEAKLVLTMLKNDVMEPQNIADLCRKLVSDAKLIDRLTNEITKGEASIRVLTNQLETVATDRSLDETDTELSKVKAELAKLRTLHKTKRAFFDETKEAIYRLSTNLQTEIQNKSDLEKTMREQPLLETQIKESTAIIRQLEEEKVQQEQSIKELNIELTQKEGERDELVSNNKEKMEKMRKELEDKKRLITDIRKYIEITQKYETGDKSKLETVANKLEEFQNNKKKLEDSKQLLIESINKKKQELASQDSRQRFLNDNVELRNSRVKGAELSKEILDLRAEIGNHNSKSICEERKSIMNKIDTITIEINRKIGEKDSIEDEIRARKAELNTKQHKESAINFKKKYYQVRIEELAVQDLENYTEALEKSVLRFHKERMVQINMTIRELWRNTYKGNDIDYIEIQTVDDIGGGANKRRSYDYKVVQVKKGVELEMRGRCSAGQKVLACLVIRMALAETFSSNCGILALDEPTTNLDRDNVMSLCDTLSSIVSLREKQKSFQLLIITHDEEFLQTLTRSVSLSHYFRVRRNADGFSEIRKEDL